MTLTWKTAAFAAAVVVLGVNAPAPAYADSNWSWLKESYAPVKAKTKRNKIAKRDTRQVHQRVVDKVKDTVVKTVSGMVPVRASTGAVAYVNPSNASKFQALIDRLEAQGTRISFMGGYRRTKIAGTSTWSKHASGNAIDICQVARNRVRCRLPGNASQIASAVGLLHGAVWNRPDAGHFEVPGGSRYSEVEKDGKKYALAWR